MSSFKAAFYSDSGRETPERTDFEDVDVIVGAGDYTESVQRPDRVRGDVLTEDETTGTLEAELEYLENTEIPAYLVPGNQDSSQEYFQDVLEQSNVEALAYDAQPVGEDLVVVAGGPYAHPELPVYVDDFVREIGVPATSSLNPDNYEDPGALMAEIIREEEEMLPGTVPEAMEDENLADLVSPEVQKAVGRRFNLEKHVEAVNGLIDTVDDSKNVVFVHHGVPNGADLPNYDLDVIDNPGTHVHGKNYGSLVSRKVLEENSDVLDAVIGGHFEGNGGESRIKGVPVFNVAKGWTDVDFNSEGVIGTNQREVL